MVLSLWEALLQKVPNPDAQPKALGMNLALLKLHHLSMKPFEDSDPMNEHNN